MDDDIRMRVKMELPFLVRVLASDAVEKAVEFMGKFGVSAVRSDTSWPCGADR